MTSRPDTGKSPLLARAPTCELAISDLLVSKLPLLKVPMSAPLRKFLNQVAVDPAAALGNRRRRTPKFCHRYFDLCDAGALECDHSALEQPELGNRSRG